MPGKKGLEAFIKKNQKKEKKPLVTKTDEAKATTTQSDTKAQDALAAQTQANIDSKTSKPKKDEDSSDEEEEEHQVLRVGNIKEKKDIVSKSKTGEESKKGYGLDDGKTKGDQAPSNMPSASGGFERSKMGGAFSTTKKTVDSISFSSGKPKFGRKKNPTKFGDSFKAGLDDIDDDENVVK